MIRQPVFHACVISCLVFSFSSQSLFRDLKGREALPSLSVKPFLIAKSEDDFGGEDFKDMEIDDEPKGGEEGAPPVEDLEDYEVIDEDLEREMEGEEEAEEREDRKKDRDMEMELVEENEGEEGDMEPVDEGVEEDEGADTSQDLDMELNKESEGDDFPDDGDPSPDLDPSPADSLPLEEEGDDFSLEDDKGAAGDLNLITNIRYLSGTDTIVIDGSETVSYQVRKNMENNQLIVEILQARMMDNLEWPYVLKDFKTDFGLIQADQKNDDTVRIVVQMKKGTGFPSTKISESGSQIIVGSGDLSREASADPGPRKPFNLPGKTLKDFYLGDADFTGSPISFHVIDAPVRQVLQFISEEGHLNMTIGEAVQGKVTLKLENVPWDQALHIILMDKNLGYSKRGSIIAINTLDNIEKRTKKLREIAENQRPLTPVKTEVIPISYGKPSEMEKKVSQFLTKPNEKRSQEAGRIIVHEETNTFIVMDTEEVIEKIKQFVSQLDKPPKQVMIEARIVEAEETFGRSFGLNWSLGGNFPVSVSLEGFKEFFAGGFSGNYDLSANDSGVGIDLNVGQIPFIGDIGASLSLAESEGYGRIVSSPRVVTISGKEASITRNSPIIIVNSTSSTEVGAASGGGGGEGDESSGNQTRTERSSTQTVDVKLELKVTPVITAKGSVFLTVDITRENPSGAAVASGDSVKTSRSAKTEVLVQNGHTIVIGGIYQYDQSSGRKGTPFLSKVPFLSWLFDDVSSSYAKNELLVFLTPKLLDTND